MKYYLTMYDHNNQFMGVAEIIKDISHKNDLLPDYSDNEPKENDPTSVWDDKDYDYLKERNYIYKCYYLNSKLPK